MFEPWPDVCLKSGIIHSVAAVVWCHHSWNTPWWHKIKRKWGNACMNHFLTIVWGDFNWFHYINYMTCLTSKLFTYLNMSGLEKGGPLPGAAICLSFEAIDLSNFWGGQNPSPWNEVLQDDYLCSNHWHGLVVFTSKKRHKPRIFSARGKTVCWGVSGMVGEELSHECAR